MNEPIMDPEGSDLKPETGYPHEGEGHTALPDEERISMLKHLGISAYWFASNFVYGALLTVVLQHEIETMVPGAQKAPVLGKLMTLGALSALVLPLLIGPLSDRCTHKWGRRRPFILVGAVLGLVGLVAMYIAAQQRELGLYFGSYFVLQCGFNTAIAAYSGVIPDFVPKSQHGIASGYMAFMSQFSTLIGAFAGGFLIKDHPLVVYVMMGGVFTAFVAWTMFALNEIPITEAEPVEWKGYFSSLLEPLRFSDFRWVWITRALMMTGFYAIQPFVLYYLKDVVHVPNPEQTSGIILALILFGATISAIAGGSISDRIGRKPVVYVASGIISAMCVGFMFCSSLVQVLIVGIVFGIGYGAYFSVDWALGTDGLPNPDDAGKVMAVWHVSMTLPQQIAALIGGQILAAFAIHGATVTNGETYQKTGYIALFGFSAVFFSLAAVLLRYVKGAR